MPVRPFSGPLGLVSLLLAGFLAGSGPLGAQQLTGPARGDDPWDARLDLSFSHNSGNSDLTTLRTGGSVTYFTPGFAEFELSGQFRWGRSSSRTIMKSTRGTLKFDHTPEDRWSPFVFGTLYWDPVRRIDLRTNAGIGAKWAFVQWEDEGEVALSLAAMGNWERFGSGADEVVDHRDRAVRWSWRIKFEKAFGDESSFDHRTFYQPVWDRPGDYFVISSTTMSTRFVGGLSLLITYDYEHDETPMEGVEPDDHALSAGFRYSF